MPDTGTNDEADELAVKTSHVEALTAENEQLRTLLQRQVDQAEATDIKRFSRGDLRRESNINDLQAALACMRSQLHDIASDYEEQKALVSSLQEEKRILHSKLSGAERQVEGLRATIAGLQNKLAAEQATAEEERARIATLRAGLDQSKRAIVILQEQYERRQSDATAARRISLGAQGILQPISAGGQLSSTNGSRKASLAFPNVAEARRGSLNYLNGLGLATKRTAYFDTSKMGPTSLADNSTLPFDHEILAGSPDAKSGSPTSASSPHLTPTSLSRRTSLAARRSSIGYETSPSRRSSHLAHTLNRLAEHGLENDLPMSRRASRVLIGEISGLSSLPEHVRSLVDPAKPRRRSSLLANPNHTRRSADKPVPSLVRDSSDDPVLKIRKLDRRAATMTRHDSSEGVIHALSLEAVLEISALRQTVEQLQVQLFESEEAREASETCAKVLREFIGSQVIAEIPAPIIRLPPLPTEADDLDISSRNAKVKKETSASKGTKSLSTMWTIPKILPSLSYGTSKKDASPPHAPTDTITKTCNSISSDLLLPARVSDIKRRSSSISSRSEYSCNSGPASPYLSFVNSGTFKPNFESFSFSAHRAQSNVPRLEPPSPLVGPTDTARFPALASSTSDSESEAEPITPLDAVFKENDTDTPRMQEKGQQRFGGNYMLVDRPNSGIAV